VSRSSCASRSWKRASLPSEAALRHSFSLVSAFPWSSDSSVQRPAARRSQSDNESTAIRASRSDESKDFGILTLNCDSCRWQTPQARGRCAQTYPARGAAADGGAMYSPVFWVIRALEARGHDRNNYSGYEASNYCTTPPSEPPGACWSRGPPEARAASTAAAGRES
jgi:hypothetical protein